MYIILRKNQNIHNISTEFINNQIKFSTLLIISVLKLINVFRNIVEDYTSPGNCITKKIYTLIFLLPT